MKPFLRAQTRELMSRLSERTGLIQIVIGPRQVGKTTAIAQVVTALKRKGFAATSSNADALASPPAVWISEQWNQARALARTGKPALLALDEVQKIPGWSELVKKEFDADQRLKASRRPRIAISGSSALLMEKGLTESLAGRFELLRFPHWSLQEESQAFGSGLKNYVALGGYPRRHELPDPDRFLAYVRDSIIESVLNKDILLLHPVDKPVLLRRLFEFACYHPAEIVSLQKMLGQLTDKGNVTTIAHYLDLLAKAFLISPLQKYSPEILRIRASSPKLIVMSQALISAVQNKAQKELEEDAEFYGRLAENAVGAHLIRSGLEVFYWRQRDEEIDFIARRGKDVLAIEVSVSPQKKAGDLKRAAHHCGIAKTLLVRPGETSLEEFLNSDPLAYL